MSDSADLGKRKSVKKRLSGGTLKEYTNKVSIQIKLSFDSEAGTLRFDFLLNDRNGDVCQSESGRHKHLLSKILICENKRLFKLVHTNENAIVYWFQLPLIILDIQ